MTSSDGNATALRGPPGEKRRTGKTDHSVSHENEFPRFHLRADLKNLKSPRTLCSVKAITSRLEAIATNVARSYERSFWTQHWSFCLICSAPGEWSLLPHSTCQFCVQFDPTERALFAHSCSPSFRAGPASHHIRFGPVKCLPASQRTGPSFVKCSWTGPGPVSPEPLQHTVRGCNT